VAKKKRTGRIIFGIILAILLVVGGFVYNEYQKVKAVKNLDVQLLDVTIEKISLQGIQLGFEIEIYNPNEIDVTVGAFNARIHANDIPLANISIPEPTNIPSLQSIQRKFSMNFGVLDLGIAVVRAIQQKEVVWKVQGEYVMQLPFGITYPYQFEIVR